MDIKFLARKGVSEALTFLGEAEDNSALGSELREKAGITSKNLGILVDEGVLERSDERVLVRTIPVRRRISTYSISDKGKRLLEICENLSSGEAKEFLRVSQQQLEVLRVLLREGPKRSRELRKTSPNFPEKNTSDFLMRMVNRGFLDKEVKEEEDKQEIYRLKRTYTLTDKGRRLYEAYRTIISL